MPPPRSRPEPKDLGILVDEDSQARAQLNLLRADGHDVVAIGEFAKNETPDPEAFDLAQSLERALLTHNIVKDFRTTVRRVIAPLR